MEKTVNVSAMCYLWVLIVFILIHLVANCCGYQNRNGGSHHGGNWRNEYNKIPAEPLKPQQSCFYEDYKRTFTCECPTTDNLMRFALNFKLGQHLLDSGKEIREVHIRHCNELDVALDLKGVDATNYPIHFRSINRVNFKGITFEPRYSDRQELVLNFYNVGRLFFNELSVRDTLEIHAINVKEAKIINSTFAHVPIRGFTVSRAKSVEIQNSYFSRIARKSIVVDKTNEVLVAHNQMTINALEVVVAKDGSRLSIACNRLLNQSPSPECMTTTTPATTSTTTTTTTTDTNRQRMVKAEFPEHAVLHRDETKNGNKGSEKGYLYEIIGGAIGGLLVIIIILLIVLILRKRNVDKSTVQENLMETTTSLNGVQFGGSKPGQMDKDDQDETKPNGINETDSLILGNEDIRADEDDEDEDKGPKFASPIWLEEIQRNKIFNRQKSLLSQDRLADLASAIPNEADAGTAEDDQINISRSPLPDKYSPKRSPIQMDEIPETREDLPRLSRNASPCLETNSTQEQLQNPPLTALVSNDQASTNLPNDDIVYNKQNEYAV